MNKREYSLSGMTTLTIEIEPRAERIETDAKHLVVFLTDGRQLIIPIEWYPRLRYGTPDERSVYELWVDGAVIAWPLLDEHIKLTALIAGARSKESKTSLEEWKKELDARRQQVKPEPWGKARPLPEWWEDE